MNILHIEQMIEVEKQLLAVVPLDAYRLHLPLPTQNSLPSSGNCLAPPSPAVQQQIERLLTHTQNLRALRQTDPNSVLRAFGHAVLAIIYPPASGPRSGPTNNLLLETLKCTLYSEDITLSGWGEEIEDLQAKAMVARFFDLLTSQKEPIGTNFGQYLEALLQCNPLISTILTVFYKAVLAKLAVQHSQERNACLDFQEWVVNLAEYFDISYRNRAELFLFHEDNIFLAMVGDQVVVGEYLDNQIDPKQVSFKDSQGFNLIQSFLLRSSMKECQKRGQKEQPKIFNFSFESGQFRYLKGETEQGTPHFNESAELVFGRKKKEEEVAEVVAETATVRLTLNGSIDSLKDFNFNECMAMLKSIEERQQQLSSKPKEESFPTAIKEMDERLQESKISVDRTKNMVNVKDKTMALLTPQASSNPFEYFSRMDNDSAFLKQSNGTRKQSASENMDTDHHPRECKCRPYRLAKNSIASTVVDFSYVPPQKTKPSIRPPPFISNLSHSQKLALYTSSRLHSPKIKRLNTLDEKPIQQGKEERKPAFLKNLKKNREMVEKESQSSFDNSKRSQQSKQSNRHALPNQSPSQKFKRFSAILKEQNQNKNKDMQLRDTLRRQMFPSFPTFPKKKPIENNTVLKKFDTNNIMFRLPGSPWLGPALTLTPRRIPNALPKDPEKGRLYPPSAAIPHANSQGSLKTSPLEDTQRILRTESSIHIKPSEPRSG